jgi:hypothetical protein
MLTEEEPFADHDDYDNFVAAVCDKKVHGFPLCDIKFRGFQKLEVKSCVPKK